MDRGKVSVHVLLCLFDGRQQDTIASYPRCRSFSLIIAFQPSWYGGTFILRLQEALDDMDKANIANFSQKTRPRSGALKKLTEADRDQIYNIITHENPHACTKDLLAAVDFKVKERSIRMLI